MVVLIEGLVNEVLPVNKAAPPEAAAYQSMVSPAPGVAVIVTVPVPHLAAPEPEGIAGTVLTVATTAVLVAAMQDVRVFLACA